jgi:PPIC-type PPIASE domain
MHRLLLALGLLACAGAPYAAEKKTDADTLVVSQGSARVTLMDVDAYLHRIPEPDRPGFIVKPDRIETMLRNLLLDKQMADEARKMGLDKDPIVQRQLQLAVENALARARTDALRDALKMPDFTEQAREEYLANREKYQTPARHDVKHILIGTKSRTESEAEKLATELAAKLAKDPSGFDAAVEALSDDQSKKDNAGLIENATGSHLVKPFATAAGLLTKPDEISPVVRTTFGFHVLKLIKYVPAQQVPYEKVSATIVARLEKEWTDSQMRAHIDNLRNLPMDPQPEVLAGLRARYMPPGTVPGEAAAAPAGDTPVPADAKSETSGGN